MTEDLEAQVRAYLDYPSVQFDEAMLMLNRLVPQLLTENVSLREIAEAVADGRAMHGEEAFALRDAARALLGKSE